MPDKYPDYPALPVEWLVPPSDQPTYTEVPGVVLDEGMNLGAALSDAHVESGAGELTAIIHHESGERISFRELAERSDRLAAGLRAAGLEPGERIAIRSANRPEGIVAAIAAWKVNAVVVPVPQIAREGELDFYFRNTTPSCVITHGTDDEIDMVMSRCREAGIGRIVVFDSSVVPPGATSWDGLCESVRGETRPQVEPELDCVAVLWHTGGTTGVPKGCYHTQRRYLLAGHSYGAATGSAPGQRWAAAAPIGHALGFLHNTIFTLLHGATTVLIERFTDPVNVLEAIARQEITTFTAITATWAAMLGPLERGEAPEPRALHKGYAMWQSSSASAVLNGWSSRGIELHNNFGSTAFATWILIPRSNALPVGALGSPAPGYEIRVVDPASGTELPQASTGRLIARGPSGLTYWRLPEKQRHDVRDGWIHLDDLIQEIEKDVYVYLGRTDFLISTSGHKVAPGEVEGVLATHPAVDEVAVVGLPDAIRQEAVAAFVVLREDANPSEELRVELQNLVKSELSPYKYPRILRFVSELPRDHVGKVQPKIIRDRALDGSLT